MDDETKIDIENLRHMTGSTRYHKEADYGFRNYYKTWIGSIEHESMKRLKKMGYASRQKDPESDRDFIYRATRKGMEYLKFTEKQIERALE